MDTPELGRAAREAMKASVLNFMLERVEMLILMRPELAGPQMNNPGWIVEVLVC